MIHHLDSPSHADISPTPADIPAEWLHARGIHLAPMPLERQLELARGIDTATHQRGPFLSLDPFEILRDDSAAHWREPLARIDALFAGEDDLRLSSPAESALRNLAGDRLRLLVLKQAERGGTLHDRHVGTIHRWDPRAPEVVDVTGAGDAFAGGFLAGWLSDGDVARGLRQGVVSASFAIEDWGSRGLARATPTAARARLEEWFPETVRGSAPEPVAG